MAVNIGQFPRRYIRDLNLQRCRSAKYMLRIPSMETMKFHRNMVNVKCNINRFLVNGASCFQQVVVSSILYSSLLEKFNKSVYFVQILLWMTLERIFCPATWISLAVESFSYRLVFLSPWWFMTPSVGQIHRPWCVGALQWLLLDDKLLSEAIRGPFIQQRRIIEGSILFFAREHVSHCPVNMTTYFTINSKNESAIIHKVIILAVL